MSAPTIHTVYRVTVRHGKKLVDYVLAAPTAQHAVDSVKQQLGGEPVVWQVMEPNKEWRQ